jgi:hypothetical protein
MNGVGDFDLASLRNDGDVGADLLFSSFARSSSF